MTIEWLAGNRLRGTTAERPNLGLPSGSVGGWVELGRTTLGSAGDSVAVSSLPDKRYYMTLVNDLATGSIGHGMRLNSDSGSNYSYRQNINGAGDSTATSGALMWNSANASLVDSRFDVGYFANLSSKEKLTTHHVCENATAGAGTAPTRVEEVGKWANTSNAISKFDLVNLLAGDYAIGSEVVVLGWDPADTHSTNFWEELYSETASGTTDFDTGTISAKKYLWGQCYLVESSGDHFNIRFNSDSGTNYAGRRSTNGGSDVTDTSKAQIAINTNSSNKFLNFFIVNNASNEKLMIYNLVEAGTTGAGNDPKRREGVAKWTNTSNQITSMVLAVDAVGGLAQAGSEFRLWGSD
jgi:hypothetical protein